MCGEVDHYFVPDTISYQGFHNSVLLQNAFEVKKIFGSGEAKQSKTTSNYI